MLGITYYNETASFSVLLQSDSHSNNKHVTFSQSQACGDKYFEKCLEQFGPTTEKCFEKTKLLKYPEISQAYYKSEKSYLKTLAKECVFDKAASTQPATLPKHEFQ